MYLGLQKTIFGAVSTRGKLNPHEPQPISLTIRMPQVLILRFDYLINQANPCDYNFCKILIKIIIVPQY